MAKIGGKKPIPISNSDLNQAILKRNNSLKRQNDSLSASIKDQEKQLKSLEKEYSAESKKLSKLLIDIEFQEDRFQKLKGGVYSTDKLLKSKLEKASEAESELCEYESIVEKLEDKESLLKKEIETLEFYKSKCIDSKIELAGIQAKKDNALDELASVKSDISKAIVEGKKRVAYYEDQYDILEEQAKKHEDMVYQFEQRLFETKDQVLTEEKNLQYAQSKCKEEKQKIDDELQAIQNLCNDTEDKYVEWEQKVKKISEKADKEEERIASAKKRFKNWRIGILEEVAKMKLKNKVDNIDKAGLSEILNG
tara:strand:+ start:103 stop:1029 length:927 start_codon:yes stop_codon:yes gene_type:complete